MIWVLKSHQICFIILIFITLMIERGVRVPRWGPNFFRLRFSGFPVQVQWVGLVGRGKTGVPDRVAMIEKSWLCGILSQLFYILCVSNSVTCIFSVDFVIGSFLPPTDEEKSKGFVGMNATILRDNLYSDYRDGNTFFKTFAVFFPAVTGIVAGANLR